MYQEKTNNSYRGGTPDDYYESDGRPGILWVEYKYVARIPRNLRLVGVKRPPLSPLQQKWLERAHRNGKPTAVIVGCPSGGIILTGLDWKKPVTKEQFEAKLLSRNEIMDWIEREVTRTTRKPP